MPFRILVVEDDASAAEFVTKGLRQDGYTVQAVGTGPDALHMATGLLADAVKVADHHHQPLRCELNRLSLLIRHLARAHPHQRDIQALASGFALLRDSLLVHLLQEELEAFPLCLELEAMKLASTTAFDTTLAEPLHFMAAGHLETGDDLTRLGQLALRAGLTSDPDVDLVIRALAAMERDLAVHTAIENEILLPAGLFTCELLSRHRPPLRSMGMEPAGDAG